MGGSKIQSGQSHWMDFLNINQDIIKLGSRKKISPSIMSTELLSMEKIRHRLIDATKSVSRKGNPSIFTNSVMFHQPRPHHTGHNNWIITRSQFSPLSETLQSKSKFLDNIPDLSGPSKRSPAEVFSVTPTANSDSSASVLITNDNNTDFNSPDNKIITSSSTSQKLNFRKDKSNIRIKAKIGETVVWDNRFWISFSTPKNIFDKIEPVLFQSIPLAQRKNDPKSAISNQETPVMSIASPMSNILIAATSKPSSSTYPQTPNLKNVSDSYPARHEQELPSSSSAPALTTASHEFNVEDDNNQEIITPKKHIQYTPSSFFDRLTFVIRPFTLDDYHTALNRLNLREQHERHQSLKHGVSPAAYELRAKLNHYMTKMPPTARPTIPCIALVQEESGGNDKYVICIPSLGVYLDDGLVKVDFRKIF